MLPTPSTAHSDYDKVYEPAEDSFLFLDLFSSSTESAFLTDRFSNRNEDVASYTPPLIVEVGVGSGVLLAFVTAHAKAILGSSHIVTLGTDVNPFACKSSTQTIQETSKDVSAQSMHSFLGIVQTDLVAGLKSGEVDVLIFNPPYVPSSEVPSPRVDLADAEKIDTQRDSLLLSLSYEGGFEGMEITKRLLSQLHQVLNRRRGVAYILLCQQNRPEKVIEEMRECQSGWDIEVVARSGMKAGWEKLQILRVGRRIAVSDGLSSES